MWIVVEIVVFIMGVVSIGSHETSVSCNFSISSCGWTNDVAATLNWSRQPVSIHNHYNYEMSLQLGQADVNASGMLSSPWMDGPIIRRSVLRFYFNLGWCVGCKLSVLLRTDTSSTLLWDTEQFSRSSGDVTTNVTCTEQSFKILFEGKKTSHGSDGTLYGIVIDDIHFKASSSITTSEYPEGVTTIQQTTQPRSDETSTHRQASTSMTRSKSTQVDIATTRQDNIEVSREISVGVQTETRKMTTEGTTGLIMHTQTGNTSHARIGSTTHGTNDETTKKRTETTSQGTRDATTHGNDETPAKTGIKATTRKSTDTSTAWKTSSVSPTDLKIPSNQYKGTDQLSTVETGNHLDGSTAVIVSICATVVAALAVLLIIVFFCWFQRRKRNDNGERNFHATRRTEQRAESNAVPNGIANNAYNHNEQNVNEGYLGSIGINLVLSNPSDQWSAQYGDCSMYDTLDNHTHQRRVSSTDISDNASYFGALFSGRTDADNYQQTVPKMVDVPIFVCENNEQVTFV